MRKKMHVLNDNEEKNKTKTNNESLTVVNFNDRVEIQKLASVFRRADHR